MVSVLEHHDRLGDRLQVGMGVDTDQSRNEANVDVVQIDEMYFSATS